MALALFAAAAGAAQDGCYITPLGQHACPVGPPPPERPQGDRSRSRPDDRQPDTRQIEHEQRVREVTANFPGWVEYYRTLSPRLESLAARRPAPRDEAELRVALRQLHDAMADTYAELLTEQRANDAYRAQLPTLMRTLQARIAQLESQLAQAPQALAAARQKRDTAIAETQIEQKRLATLRAADSRMERHEARAVQRIVDDLGSVLPEKNRIALKEALERRMHAPKEDTWASGARAAVALPALAHAAPARPVQAMPQIARRQPRSDSVEDLVAALEYYGAYLGDPGRRVVADRPEVAALKAGAESARSQAAALQARLAPFDGERARLEADVREATRQQFDAHENGRRAAINALSSAATAAVWDRVSKDVAPVVDQAKRALGKKMVDLTAKSMEHWLDEMRILNPSQVSALKRLIEVERQVLQVAHNFESYALRAVQALAHGSAEDALALSNELFADLEQREREMIRTARGSLFTPLAKIAAILLDRQRSEATPRR